MRKRFDDWLIEWLDTRYYSARWQWQATFWGRLAQRSVNRYWDRYGFGPTVGNG
jgi:hypothetical protein